MPFVRVGYMEDQYTEKELPLISRCILDALIEHFQVPEKDYFQVFHAHKQSEFYYSPDYLDIPRTDKLLYIQITMGLGRTTEQKRASTKGYPNSYPPNVRSGRRMYLSHWWKRNLRIGPLATDLPR